MGVTPVRFRLYPESRRGLYLAVFVWPTRASMQRRWGPHPPRTDGFCHPFIVQQFVGGRWRTRPVVAEVHFHRARLSMEVVTHELFHATIAWARRIRFDFARLNAEDSINEDEERLTYAHGRLCREFMNRANDFKLYSDGIASE
jgi:hypothetical protein